MVVQEVNVLPNDFQLVGNIIGQHLKMLYIFRWMVEELIIMEHILRIYFIEK